MQLGRIYSNSQIAITFWFCCPAQGWSSLICSHISRILRVLVQVRRERSQLKVVVWLYQNLACMQFPQHTGKDIDHKNDPQLTGDLISASCAHNKAIMKKRMPELQPLCHVMRYFLFAQRSSTYVSRGVVPVSTKLHSPLTFYGQSLAGSCGKVWI